MAILFPSAPYDGQTHTESGKTWRYTSGKGWKTVPQEQSAYSFMGAMVKKAADATAQNFTSATAITFDTEVFDYGGFFDSGASTTRLTVPAGVSRVRIKAGVRVDSLTADLFVAIVVYKNGSPLYDGVGQQLVETGSTSANPSLVTGDIPVVAGDWFELYLQIETDTSVTITAARTWFEIVAVEQTARTLAVPQTLHFVCDGGGNEITVGIQGDMIAPYDMWITEVTLLADRTGSIVVNIWEDTYANYPPTVADSICGSSKPTISSGVKYQDTVLTGWTRFIPQGAVLRFNVESVSLIERCTIALKVTR